ncbi:MAG: XTP/dITP diphosphatase [bacterium]
MNRIKELILATGNTHKAAEIKYILKDFPLKIITLKDLPVVPEIIEDGKSFKENAFKKASALVKATGKAAFADDSGLEVDALSGEPGVYSSRYAGDEGNDEKNNMKLLQNLMKIPAEGRTARFRCAIALSLPDNGGFCVEGKCEGRIGFKPQGSNGFGYDPLFIPDGYEITFAEISHHEKNRISHRSQALSKFADKFGNLFCK